MWSPVCVAAARSHVNRMCLAADIPLVESGTAGYLGQVTVIKKVWGGGETSFGVADMCVYHCSITSVMS